MPITRTPIIDDDGFGRTGTIFNNAWKQELYGQIDQALGAWVDVPQSGCTFQASGGTWTVSAGFVTMMRYQAIPGTKVVVVQFNLGGTSTITPASANLIVNVSGLPSAAIGTLNACQYWVETGFGAAWVQSPGGGALYFVRDISGTQWPAQTNVVTYFRGQIFYQSV